MSETARPAGELIIYQGRLHWSIFVRPVMFSCLAALLFNYDEPLFGAAATLAAGLFWAAALVAAWGSVFVITERRVLIRTGTVYRVNLDLPLDQIERAEVRQDTMGRLLGYGTLVVDGSDGAHIVCPSLAHAAEFTRQLQSVRAGA